MASLARAPFQVAEAMASLEVLVPAPQLWYVKGSELVPKMLIHPQ